MHIPVIVRRYHILVGPCVYLYFLNIIYIQFKKKAYREKGLYGNWDLPDITVDQSTPAYRRLEFAYDFHAIQYPKRNILVGRGKSTSEANDDCEEMVNVRVRRRENKYHEHACEKN